MKEPKQVITFLNETEIRKIIDETAISVISYLFNKTVFSQPERLHEGEPTGMQITKEFLESWIAQSCDLKKIGAGSYPVDVYKPNEFGADIKSVSAKVNSLGNLTNGTSGESSLGQKFEDGDINLDTLFKNKDKNQILNKWLKILEDKFKKPSTDFNLKNYFYFIFIRAGSKMYLCIAKVHKENLKFLTGGNITKTSLFIENFISNKHGNVKIYKSKKRMELRLFTKKLVDDKLTICWDFNNHQPTITNLRKISKDGNLQKHLNSEIKKFFNQ